MTRYFVQDQNQHITTVVVPDTLHPEKEHVLRLPTHGFQQFISGAKVQEAFPGLSVDDREILISGYGPESWKELFGDEE